MLSYPGLLSLNFYLRFRNYEIQNWLFDPVDYSLDVNFYRLSLFSISPSCIFIVSAVVAEDAGIKGKRAKKLHFFVFDDCSRNNSSSSITTFTYYVHKFRFTFFIFLFESSVDDDSR